MDKLLQPDFGLMFWTLVTFLILVGILKPLAWDPLLKLVEEREEGLRRERQAAEDARAQAQKIKEDLERELARIDSRCAELLSRASKEAQTLKEEVVQHGHLQAKQLIERARRQLEDEKNRLVGELRAEVAKLSVLAAEKLLKRSVDAGVQRSVLSDFFQGLKL